MRPITFIVDDLDVLTDADDETRDRLRDVVVFTPESEIDDDAIVLDAPPSSDHADDFMDRIVAMLTDLPVVFTLSALIGERSDVAAALAEPLTKATLNLAGLRRFHGAFDGDYSWESDDNGLLVEWVNGDQLVRLHVPDPREGTDFTLVAKGPFGDFEWCSYHDLDVDF